MKHILSILPLLFVVAGCHASTPVTPKDESFVAFVSARSFSVCSDQFLITTNRDVMFCACVARTVADNTRAVKLFDRKLFKARGDEILPTEDQMKACQVEVQ